MSRIIIGTVSQRQQIGETTQKRASREHAGLFRVRRYHLELNSSCSRFDVKRTSDHSYDNNDDNNNNNNNFEEFCAATGPCSRLFS